MKSTKKQSSKLREISFESSKMIKNHLKRWAQIQEGLSLRSWAKLMKVSPAYLSLVLNSKKLVTTEVLDKIIKALDLDAISRKNLLEARERDWLQSNNINIKNLVPKIVKPTSVEQAEEIIDSSVLIQSWLHMALLDFATCEGFTEDSSVLAGYFETSPSIIRKVMIDLESAGFFKRDTNKKLIKVTENMRVSVPRSSQAIRAFHLAMMKKAMKTLEKTPASSEVVSKRLVGCYTVAVNEENLTPAFDKMNTAVQSVVEDLKKGFCTAVYQVQYQILPLINIKNKPHF